MLGPLQLCVWPKPYYLPDWYGHASSGTDCPAWAAKETALAATAPEGGE